MTLLLTSIVGVRRSLFSVLGLLVACGPTSAGTDSDGGSDGSSSSTASTTPTTPTTASDSPPACDGELVEIAQAHVEPTTPSGYQQCDDGMIHRAEARECLMPATPTSCPGTGGGECKTNEDCTEQPFGSCQLNSGDIDSADCACVYGCRTDADCDVGEVCRCAGAGLGQATRCISAQCTLDADCGGVLCGLSPDDCVNSPVQACQTPQDSCDQQSDCGVPCVFADDRWQCQTDFCGRPFVVAGAPARAPAIARDDWRALLAAPSAPPALRRRLAAHWTRIAGFEHASVASFARFILDLLTLGAPPELVLAAQQALADEVEHARIGFALASLYEGTGVGPGPLPTADADPRADPDALIAAAIAEACVAETLAGLELLEAAAHAADPGLRRVLARIAGDEQRHAELGWRFVRWALEGADAPRRERARAAFAGAIAQAEAELSHMSELPADPELRAHGVVDPPLRAAAWRRGLDALVRPAAAAVCAA
ncbi:ferritin-like domain-containing protein [Nannocystis punicea]|uniref:Ferritin-like domain-containing protein n=1 Tax=Nannocystis punicea TaxID=2995304 RepID=A0ABY7GUS9_9BACT|nr:ferritin-like domain-containing protein [Nannocystis poenicansa]WAS90706.1 ferritin-like domain-containing protein [Nannocystis poenicansa]